MAEKIRTVCYWNKKGNNQTVNTERFIQTLTKSKMKIGSKIGIEERYHAWFQQDGAIPQIASAILQWLTWWKTHHPQNSSSLVYQEPWSKSIGLSSFEQLEVSYVVTLFRTLIILRRRSPIRWQKSQKSKVKEWANIIFCPYKHASQERTPHWTCFIVTRV